MPKTHSRSMVLLAICVVTGGLVFYVHKSSAAKQQRLQQAQHELAMIKQAISSHLIEWNRYPDESKSATETLILLKTPIRGGGPLLLDLWQGEEEPKDPWGRDYCMLPGSRERPPVFYSSGPNGKDEGGYAGTDDVIAPETIAPSDQQPKPSSLK
ncbi:type II secretion system protein GspG [Prosthecobacter sp.]|uniref:type II secretion system protein GspG n=1 Tax=Prosthecobacter sp. TaxID=1965333 RepID=UPI0025EB298F|nr:type II secretion system protein GspG [Prosthecobacter sp.]